MMTLEITQRAREIAARVWQSSYCREVIITGRDDKDYTVQAAQLALNESAAEIGRLREALRTIADDDCVNPWGIAQEALETPND
jgi:hypothetical protein